MITLHQFPPAPGLPNASPPCMKVEAFLRLAEIPYQAAPPDFRAAPKGRVPYVDLDGELVGESGLIIDRLAALHGIDLDAGLDPRERAAAHAFGRMLDDDLYLAMLYERWLDDANWALVRTTFFASVPETMRAKIAEGVRTSQRQRLEAHGMGSHTPEEVAALGRADVDALAQLLGERPFMMGETPSLLDCTAHAYVANLLIPPFTGPLKDAAQAHANLVAYNQRMLARVFPEALA